MKTFVSSGLPFASGTAGAGLPPLPPRPGSPALSRPELHRRARRAYFAMQTAGSDLAYADAKEDFDRLARQLAAIAEIPVGRVPSQDVDSNSPGYVPGLSKAVL